MSKRTTFRHVTCGLLAALLSVSAAAPAMADRDRDRHDRRWDDHRRGGDDHHYWRKRHQAYHHRYDYYPPYRNRVVVTNYYTPAPTYYYEPVSYTPANVQRITCRENYNPLPALLGAGAGGVIGSTIGKGHGRTAAIISGALIGGSFMHSYGSYDRTCTRQVFESVPVGTPVQWANNDTSYTVTPTRDYRTEGRYCREYQAKATVGNRMQETYGTACMQPDGAWEIVN